MNNIKNPTYASKLQARKLVEQGILDAALAVIAHQQSKLKYIEVLEVALPPTHTSYFVFGKDTVIPVTNISAYCRLHNLDASNMNKVNRGERTSTCGYSKATDAQIERYLLTVKV